MENTLLAKKPSWRLLLGFAFLAMLIPGKGFGQSLLVEDFTGTVGTNLTANGWVAHSGANTGPMTIASPGLTYPGYLSSGVGNATSPSGNSEDVNKAFTSTTTGSVYYAFMVSSNTTVNSTDYCTHFCATSGSSATGFYGRFFIQKDASNNVRFGISKLSETAVYTPYSYSLNTTYLIVIKYTFVAGSTNDTVVMYVNPVPGSAEPASPTLTASSTPADAAGLAAVAIRQFATTTLARFDGIRVGTTWESVTPSSTTVPTVTNTVAADITTNSATLAGNVTATGGDAVTATGSVYALTSLDASPTIGEANVTTLATSSPSAGTGAFSNTTGTGLAVNTQYSYNAYATNGIGTSYGTAATFYTLAVTPNAPVVGSPTTNSLVVSLDTSDANPSGTAYAIQETGGLYVQADGTLGASPVWRTETAWGAAVTVTGLSSVTTYTFQVKGRNGDEVETAFGPSASATTNANLSPTIEADPLAAFGSLCINNSATNSFAFIGYNLTAEAVTVGPLLGYSFSTTLTGTYTSSLSFTPDVNGEVAETVYVKFTPTAVASYNGLISISGGGVATAETVAVSGSGINTPVSVVTGSSASVTSNSAVLNGTFTAGCSAVTASGIEYSVAADFSASATIALGGTASSLLPNTTYYFRAFATDATGTVSGTSASFTTLNLSAPVATAATAVGTSSFTANWEAVTGAAAYALDVYTQSSGLSGTVTNLITNTASLTGWTFTAVTEETASGGYLKMVSSTSVLTSPTLDVTNYGTLKLNMKVGSFGTVSGNIAKVTISISTNNGNTWTIIGEPIGTTGTNNGTVIPEINLDAYAGTSSQVKIRMQTLSATGSAGARVSNITLSGNQYFTLNTPVSGSPFAISAPTTATVVSGLSSNTNYYYTVKAVNGAAVSPSSNEVAVTTLVAPPTFGSVFQTSDVVCENGAATFNVVGLVPNSISTISYTVNGGAVQTATNVVANASGFATFNVTLSLADNGQLLAITQIERTDFTASVLTLNSGNTAAISVSANVTYYADADGDGFGNAAISVVSCDGVPVVFGNPAVLNNTDCDDSDNTKNAAFSFYLDTDEDGVGFGSLVSGVCAVNATTPPAGYSLTNTDCSPNDSAAYREGTFYVDADGDNYAANSTSIVLCYGAVAPNGYSMVNLGIDCDDTIAAINPGASEILYDGVDNNCNDILDEGFQITATMANCGTTLSSLGSLISCVSLPGINGWRFEVTNTATGAVQTIDRTLNYFSINMLPSFDYATTYSIRVMLRKSSNNVWLGYYGPACLYSTPPVISQTGGAGTTQLQTYCGQTLPTMGTLISTTSLPAVTGYRFRVIDTETGSVQTLTRTANWFSLNMLSTYRYGTTYLVDVAVKTTGDFSDYGASCTVTSPAVPTLTNYCGGAVVPTQGALITTSSLSFVTAYEFTVDRYNSSFEVVSSSVVVKSLPRFTFRDITNYAPNTLYGVRVRVLTAGSWSPYSDACEIVSPGAAREMETKAVDTNLFSVVGYPNPYDYQFNFRMESSSDAPVSIKVYDMIGKLIETREVNAADMPVQSLGERYPSGVYNVVVTQEDHVKTLRMVKR